MLRCLETCRPTAARATEIFHDMDRSKAAVIKAVHAGSGGHLPQKRCLLVWQSGVVTFSDFEAYLAGD